jgi:hypothetical protein
LAAVHRFALVGVELLLNSGLCVSHLRIPGKLSIAAFADSEHRDAPDSLYDPKAALWHEESLAHSAGRA